MVPTGDGPGYSETEGDGENFVSVAFHAGPGARARCDLIRITSENENINCCLIFRSLFRSLVTISVSLFVILCLFVTLSTYP